MINQNLNGRNLLKRIAALLLLVFSYSHSGTAQENALEEMIYQKDSIFWKSYNDCDMAGMEQFIAEDIEFYHDKGGITYGKTNLSNSLKNGLCQSGKNELRREAVPGSVHVYPLKSNGKIYGALMTGKHLFYLVKGASEKLDGQAKFSHLWLEKDGEWKMSRVFSYDHGPAAFDNPKQAIELTEKELKKFTGKYLSDSNDQITVELKKDHLELQAMGKTFILYPDSQDSFFTKERDLSFHFSNKTPGTLTIFESDTKVVEATRNQKQ